MAVTVLGMLGFAGFAVAWSLGAFESKAAAKPIDRTGQLAFPAIARPMSAFDGLSKDDFIDPRTNQLNVIWLPESTAEVASRSLSELIGRVLKRDKQSGMVLTEADFLEKGTRQGLVAGIPVDKLAMSIPAAGIPGLEQLRGGDRFDLLVSLPMKEDSRQLSNSEPAALFGGIKPPSLRVGQLSRQHGVKHLVTDGMLVTLFSGAQTSVSGPSGLTVVPNGSKSKAPKTVATVFAELAVDPDEIGSLTEAIALGTKMICVLHSGLPGGEVSDAFSTKGLVPVITTAVPVNAFSALTDENLMDESSGRLHFYYFPADKISKEWISDPAQLYGRVVARPLRRGSFITESDLLPPGTRPGISAGLPAGMAAMSIDKTNMQGFEKLVAGDTFSILTRVPEAVGGSVPQTTWASVFGGKLSSEDERLELMIRTGIREVAREAVYLSDPDDTTVVIGVVETDVAKVAQLIRDKSDIFVIANSSRDRQTTTPANSKTHLLLDSAVANDRLYSKVSFVSQMTAETEAGRSDEESELLPFPVLVQEVPAFRPLRIDDFLDPASGQVRRLYFPPSVVKPDWESDIRELIDRTTIRTLQPGRIVSTSDLAPKGLPAGPSLGVPAGMRGVTVNSLQLVGLANATAGTRFDIVAPRGVKVADLADRVRPSLSSEDAIKEASKLPSGSVSASRVVAENVLLVANFGEATIVVSNRVGAVERKTQTLLQPDGSTITTESVIEDPTTVNEQLVVQQAFIAVPEASLTSLLGLLNEQPALMASLHPIAAVSVVDEKTIPSATQRPLPVRAIIQEHIRGQTLNTEVFLTDRPVNAVLAAKPPVFEGESGGGL